MISRRLIRIKVMQIHYVFLQTNGFSNLKTLEKELQYSIEQSYNLFLSLHCLLLSIFDFAKEKIEIRKKKLIPTLDDLNPNTKFIDNKIIALLNNNPILTKASNNSNLNWSEHYKLINNIYDELINSNYYQDFMNNKKNSSEQDYAIIKYIIEKIIIKNSLLIEILEDRNIFWNDDLEFWASNILQYLKKIKIKDTSVTIPQLWKDQDDIDFSKNLLKHSVLNKDKYDIIISDSLQKWELDRLALIDRALLHLALCEFLEMPFIPVKVTINEYIEISKFYSTEKSSIFINGILDKINNDLKKEGKIIKTGRGLAEI